MMKVRVTCFFLMVINVLQEIKSSCWDHSCRSSLIKIEPLSRFLTNSDAERLQGSRDLQSHEPLCLLFSGTGAADAT